MSLGSGREAGCSCGLKPMFCHAANAARYCSSVSPEAVIAAQRDRYRAALIECATISGADVSGGVPTWPDVDVWAVQEVQQLRDDSDEDPS